MGNNETAHVNFAADPGSVADLSAQIRAGTLTPTALLERYLERIEAVDRHVQAWRDVAAESAQREAEQLTREAKSGAFRGALHGIPVGIKDIIDVAGMRTLANSRSRADAPIASADAEVVASLRLAGAVILGKTHTTEFAYFDPSPARNPHNVGHTPGGSSSGSGAAVAAGTVPLTLGTQTVASTNRPAAYCGIAAFKPSTQSTCLYGVLPLAPAFDTVGCYGRHVADAAALYEAMCPPPVPSAVPSPDGALDIVQIEDPMLDDCDAGISAAVRAVAERLAAAGHRLRRAPSPVAFDKLYEAQMRAMKYEGARIYRRLREAPAGSVGPKFMAMVHEGLEISDEQYRQDRGRLAQARAVFWRTFPHAGVSGALLFPASPKTAPPGIESTGDPKYISPWTALGGPIVTLPAGLHPNGLPIGVLLCGCPGTDHSFTRTASILDAERR
jgi:aspartyl-tRNA(Asn)/glutamyl-tRNA(Gln) amidotransferase subunit A